MVLKELRIENI